MPSPEEYHQQYVRYMFAHRYAADMLCGGDVRPITPLHSLDLADLAIRDVLFIKDDQNRLCLPQDRIADNQHAANTYGVLRNRLFDLMDVKHPLQPGRKERWQKLRRSPYYKENWERIVLWKPAGPVLRKQIEVGEIEDLLKLDREDSN